MALVEEVVKEYKTSLDDLNFNSKPLINMLTMLADDNEQHAPHIVKVIEDHITKRKAEKKLPVLYLIDSIMKNLPKSSYKSLFAKNIVQTFTSVFEQVDEKTRASMYKLRQTWGSVMNAQKLYMIDYQINNFLDPAWPITAPPPEQVSIHVNPKFLPQTSDSESTSPEVQEEEEVEEEEEAADGEDPDETLLRQQLIAKQQELLKIKQASLELELAEAAEKIKLKKKTASKAPAAPVVSKSSKKQHVSPKASTEAPIPRDPRLNTGKPAAHRDPRLARSSAPSSAIVSSTTPSLVNPNVPSVQPGIGPSPSFPGIPQSVIAGSHYAIGSPPYAAYSQPNGLPGQHGAGLPLFSGPGEVFTGEVYNSPDVARFSEDDSESSWLSWQDVKNVPPPLPAPQSAKKTVVNSRDPRFRGKVQEESKSHHGDSHSSRHHQSEATRHHHHHRTEPAKHSSDRSKHSTDHANSQHRTDFKHSHHSDTKVHKEEKPSRPSDPRLVNRDSKERDRISKDKERLSKERDSTSPRQSNSHSSAHKSSSSHIQTTKQRSSSSKEKELNPVESVKDNRDIDKHRKEVDKSKASNSSTKIASSKSSSKLSPKSDSSDKSGKARNSPRKSSSSSSQQKLDKDGPSREKKSRKSEDLKKSESKPVTPNSSKSHSDLRKEKSSTSVRVKSEPSAKVKDEAKESKSSSNISPEGKGEKRTSDVVNTPRAAKKLKIEQSTENDVNNSATDLPMMDVSDDIKQETSGAAANDISDLFGCEDQDYRSLEQKALPMKSPSSKGWDTFKAQHSEEFAHDIQLKKQREETEHKRRGEEIQDTDYRCLQRQASTLSAASDDSVISKEMLTDHHAEILLTAHKQLQEGQITHEQHQMVIKKLGELMAIQKLQEEEIRRLSERSASEETDLADSSPQPSHRSPRQEEPSVQTENPPTDRGLDRFKIPRLRNDREGSQRKGNHDSRGELSNLYPDLSINDQGPQGKQQADQSIKHGPERREIEKEWQAVSPEKAKRGGPMEEENWRGDPDYRGPSSEPNRRGPPQGLERQGGPPSGSDRRGHLGETGREGPSVGLDRRGPPREISHGGPLVGQNRRGPPAGPDERSHPGGHERRGPPGNQERPPVRMDRRGPPGEMGHGRPPGEITQEGPPVGHDRRGPPEEMGRGMPPVGHSRRGLPEEIIREGPPDGLHRRGPHAEMGQGRPPLELDRRGPPGDMSREGPSADFDRRGQHAEMERGRPPFESERRGPTEDIHREGPPVLLDRRGQHVEIGRGIPPFESERRGPPEDLNRGGQPAGLVRGQHVEMERGRPPFESERRGPPEDIDREGPPVLFDIRDQHVEIGRGRSPFEPERRGPPEDMSREGPPAGFDRRGPHREMGRGRPPIEMNRRGPPGEMHREGPPAEFERRGPGEIIQERLPAELDRHGPLNDKVVLGDDWRGPHGPIDRRQPHHEDGQFLHEQRRPGCEVDGPPGEFDRMNIEPHRRGPPQAHQREMRDGPEDWQRRPPEEFPEGHPKWRPPPRGRSYPKEMEEGTWDLGPPEDLRPGPLQDGPRVVHPFPGPYHGPHRPPRPRGPLLGERPPPPLKGHGPNDVQHPPPQHFQDLHGSPYSEFSDEPSQEQEHEFRPEVDELSQDSTESIVYDPHRGLPPWQPVKRKDPAKRDQQSPDTEAPSEGKEIEAQKKKNYLGPQHGPPGPARSGKIHGPARFHGHRESQRQQMFDHLGPEPPQGLKPEIFPPGMEQDGPAPLEEETLHGQGNTRPPRPGKMRGKRLIHPQHERPTGNMIRPHFNGPHGPRHRGPVQEGQQNMTREPNAPIEYIDMNGDPRFRAFVDMGPEVSEEVVLGKRNYEIKLGAPPRRIQWGSELIEVFADPSKRGVVVDGILMYKFGERVKEVTIRGRKEKIFYHGKPLNLWIEGQHYEVRVDSPPKAIFINSKPHRIQIDGRDMMILIDKEEKGKYGGDSRFVFIDSDRMEIRFEPPPRHILIDGKLCELKLNTTQPCVNIEGKLHGIRFDGPPRDVFINGHVYQIFTDHAIKLRVGNRYHYVSLGGPCFELIVDGKWFEVKFNEQPKEVSVGNTILMVQLPGSPPDVKILPELAKPLMSITIVRPERPPAPIMPGQPPPMMQQPPVTMVHMPPPPGQMLHPPPGMMQMPPVSMMPPMIPGLMPPVTSVQPPVSGAAPPSILTNLFKTAPTTVQQAVSAPLDINSLLAKLVSTGILPKDQQTKESAAAAKPKPSTSSTEAASGKQEKVATDPTSGLPAEFASIKKKNQAQEEKFDDIPDMTEMDPTEMKGLPNGAIQRLYAGIQCTSCGTRFRLNSDEMTEKYRQHLDWHFRQNRRDKEDTRVVRCRKWYYGINDWLQYQELGDAEEQTKSSVFENQQQDPSQPAEPQLGLNLLPDGTSVIKCPPATGNDSDDLCDICHEPFEQYWDEEHEQWHLREAIRVNNKTYHPICYEDYTDVSEGTPSPSVLSITEPNFSGRKTNYDECSQDGVPHSSFEEERGDIKTDPESTSKSKSDIAIKLEPMFEGTSDSSASHVAKDAKQSDKQPIPEASYSATTIKTETQASDDEDMSVTAVPSNTEIPKISSPVPYTLKTEASETFERTGVLPGLDIAPEPEPEPLQPIEIKTEPVIEESKEAELDNPSESVEEKSIKPATDENTGEEDKLEDSEENLNTSDKSDEQDSIVDGDIITGDTKPEPSVVVEIVNDEATVVGSGETSNPVSDQPIPHEEDIVMATEPVKDEEPEKSVIPDDEEQMQVEKQESEGHEGADSITSEPSAEDESSQEPMDSQVTTPEVNVHVPYTSLSRIKLAVPVVPDIIPEVLEIGSNASTPTRDELPSPPADD